MAKHNIDHIAAVAIAAHTAFENKPSSTEATPELMNAVRIRVLEEIHGEPKKDQAGGTEDERRADRLFSAIVKALTVRL